MAKFFPPGTCFCQISALMNIIQLGCLNSLVQSVSKCFENENRVMHQEKACLVWLHPFTFRCLSRFSGKIQVHEKKISCIVKKNSDK